MAHQTPQTSTGAQENFVPREERYVERSGEKVEEELKKYSHPVARFHTQGNGSCWNYLLEWITKYDCKGGGVEGSEVIAPTRPSQTAHFCLVPGPISHWPSIEKHRCFPYVDTSAPSIDNNNHVCDNLCYLSTFMYIRDHALHFKYIMIIKIVSPIIHNLIATTYKY